MYEPIKDGVAKTNHRVRYTVEKPPAHLSSSVHRYWELKTESTLEADFRLHAMPDACVNILFNLRQTEIAGVTALRTQHEVLQLGRCFHYVGIELLPGVWRGNPQEIAHQFVGSAYVGQLPLVETNKKLAGLGFLAMQPLMTELVEWLIAARLVVRNPVAEKILANLDGISSVADMAALVCLSPRQLQRTLQNSTGFAPHDLLKILRVQQSFRQHYLDLYADQSHYIHSFRKVTGYTPGQYKDTFDV